MDLKEIGKKFLSIGLPALGTALGGPPLGLAAKAAVGLIQSKFGTSPEGVIEYLDNPVATKSVALKLKELEMEHEVKLRQLMVDEAQIELDDIADARGREMEIVKATGEKDINLYILSWIVVAGFFGTTLMALMVGIGNNPITGILIGGLISGFSQVLGYFFGSSRSSKEKTKMMNGGLYG